nr:hypothetical protein [Tanacetum cinerariifolium]
IVSPLDVHVHHEVPTIHTSTLLAVPILVIPEASPVYTNIPQSSQTFTYLPLQVIALEKDVVELNNDTLHTQVTALVDDHLDTSMGATREEFMNFLSASLTDRITKQVRNQLPQILLEELSNFAPPVIKKMAQESLNEVNLAKASSQPQSTYEAEMTLTKFELKKILIDNMNLSKSYLTAPEHQECYMSCQDDKDKDEGPCAGSDRGLKKRKISKDAEPTTSLKTKDSSSRSSKGTKSQHKSFGKSVHVEEPVFEVGDTDMPQGQEGNQGNDNVEPRIESASKHNWSQNLHVLKNSLIPTRMKTRPLRKDQLKTG